MTEAELDKLAQKVAEKMEHKACPLGMTQEGVEASTILGRAHSQVHGDDSSYILLLRLGKEADSMAIKVIRWLVIGIILIAIALFGKFGLEHAGRMLH